MKVVSDIFASLLKKIARLETKLVYLDSESRTAFDIQLQQRCLCSSFGFVLQDDFNGNLQAIGVACGFRPKKSLRFGCIPQTLAKSRKQNTSLQVLRSTKITIELREDWDQIKTLLFNSPILLSKPKETMKPRTPSGLIPHAILTPAPCSESIEGCSFFRPRNVFF